MNYTYNNLFVDKTLIPKTPIEYKSYLDNTQFQPTQALSSGILLNTSEEDLNNPNNWFRTDREQEETTRAEARILEQEVAILSNSVLNNALTTGGVDPSKGILLRQMMGSPAFRDIAISRSDISSESILVKEGNYNKLLGEVTEAELENPDVQAAITKEHNELTYMKYVMTTPDLSAGFDYPTYVRASGSVGGEMLGFITDMLWFNFDTISRTRASLKVMDVLGYTYPGTEKIEDVLNLNVAEGTVDIERILSRDDKHFNHERWFTDELTKNPVVAQGMADMGITKEYFFGVRNKEAAIFKIASRMNITDIHNRLQSYNPGTSWISPGWYVKQAANLKDMFTNNIDTPIMIGGDILMTATMMAIAGSVAPGPGTAVGGVVGTTIGVAKNAARLSKLWSVLKGTGSTAWHLGFGGLPTYARSWSLVRPLAWHFGQGAGFMVAHNITAQENNIAFANSVYALNPEMQTSINTEEVIHSAIAGGLFASSFSLLHSGVLQLHGKLTGRIDTPLARSIYNYKKATGSLDVVDLDPITKLVNEAVAEGRVPTVEEVNAKLAEQAEAVETANSIHTGDVAIAPIEPLSRRATDESLDSFAIRTASSRSMDSHHTVLDAVSEGGRYNMLPIAKKAEAVQAAIVLAKKIEETETSISMHTEEPISVRPEFHADVVTQLVKEAESIKKQLDAEVVIGDGASIREAAISILDAAIDGETPIKPIAPVVDATVISPDKAAELAAEIAADLELTPPGVVKAPEWRPKILNQIDNAVLNSDIDGVVGLKSAWTTLKSMARNRSRGRKLSAVQRTNILAVLDSDNNFLTPGRVKGDPDKISKFYNELTRLVETNTISREAFILILASTVNTKFSKELTIAIDPAVSYANSRLKLIGIEKGLSFTPTQWQAYTVLHELGHTFEFNLVGTPILKLRKLFSHQDSVYNALKDRSTLTAESSRRYISSGTTELFADTFADMLTSELNYTTSLKNIELEFGTKSAITVEIMLAIAEKLIDVYDLLKNTVSNRKIFTLVKESLHILEQAYLPETNRAYLVEAVAQSLMSPTALRDILNKGILTLTKDINDRLRRTIFNSTKIMTSVEEQAVSKYLFTNDEAILLFELSKNDTGAVESFVMTKAEGYSLVSNGQKDFMARYSFNRNITKVYMDTVIANYTNMLRVNKLAHSKAFSERALKTLSRKDLPIETELQMIRSVLERVPRTKLQVFNVDFTVPNTFQPNSKYIHGLELLNLRSETLRKSDLMNSDDGHAFGVEVYNAIGEIARLKQSANVKKTTLKEALVILNTEEGEITLSRLRDVMGPDRTKLLLTNEDFAIYLKDHITLETEVLKSIIDNTYTKQTKANTSYPWTGNNHYTVAGNRIYKSATETAKNIIKDINIDPKLRQTLKIMLGSYEDVFDQVDMFIIPPTHPLYKANIDGIYLSHTDLNKADYPALSGSIFLLDSALTERGMTRGRVAATVVHEMAHAISQDKLVNALDNLGLVDHEPVALAILETTDANTRQELLNALRVKTQAIPDHSKAVRRIMLLYCDYLEYTISKPLYQPGDYAYGGTNVYEFVSEALSSPDFQAELSIIPSSLKDKDQVPFSMLRSALAGILRLLGLTDLVQTLQERGITAMKNENAVLEFFELGSRSVLEDTVQETLLLKNYKKRQFKSRDHSFAWEINQTNTKLTSEEAEAFVENNVTQAEEAAWYASKKTKSQLNVENSAKAQAEEAVRQAQMGPKTEENIITVPDLAGRTSENQQIPRTTEAVLRRLAGIDFQIGERNKENNPTLVTAVVEHLGLKLGLSSELIDSLSNLPNTEAVSLTIISNIEDFTWKVNASKGGIFKPTVIKRQLTAVHRSRIKEAVDDIKAGDIAEANAAKVAKTTEDKTVMIEAATDNVVPPTQSKPKYAPTGPAISEDQVTRLFLKVKLFQAAISRRASKIPFKVRSSGNFSEFISQAMVKYYENPSIMLSGRADQNKFLNVFALAVERLYFKELEKLNVGAKTNINQTNYKEFLEALNDTLAPDKKITTTFDEMIKAKGELYNDFKSRYGVSKQIQSSTGEEGALTIGAEAGTKIETKAIKVAASVTRGERFRTMRDNLLNLGVTATDNALDTFILDGLIEGSTIPQISTAASSKFKSGTSISNIEKRAGLIRKKFLKAVARAVDPDDTKGISKLPDDEVLGMLATISKEEWENLAATLETTTPKNSKQILEEAVQNQLDKEVQLHIEEAIVENSANKTNTLSVGVIPDATIPQMAIVQSAKKPAKPTGITPHIPLGSAERVASTSTFGVTTVASQKKLKLRSGMEERFTTSNKLGYIKDIYYPALADMEGILVAIKFDKIDVSVVSVRMRELFSEGKQEQAIKEFLEAMAEEKLDGVQLYGKSDKAGKSEVVRRFVFNTEKWTYGSQLETQPKETPVVTTKVKSKKEELELDFPEEFEFDFPEATIPATTLAPDTKTVIPITKPAQPAKSISIPVESTVVKTTEVDRIHQALTAGNEGLRDSGVDASAFRRILSMLKTAAKKAKFEITEEIPVNFKSVFRTFIETNAKIMQYNRNKFRSETIVQSFWKEVDKIVAREAALKVTIKNKVTYMTKTEIYAEAANKVSTSNLTFLPPIPDFSIRFSFDKQGVPTLEFYKNVQYIIDQAENSTKDLPATPTPHVSLDELHAKAAPPKQVDKESKVSNEAMVDTLFEIADSSSSRLLRGNTFLGWFMGGSERANRNWWRSSTSGLGNGIQHASSIGSTIRSMETALSFLSVMFDDTRIMTGTLVAPGTSGIRSFLRAKAETARSSFKMLRISKDLQASMKAAGMTQKDVKPMEVFFLKAFAANKELTAADLKKLFPTGTDFTTVAHHLAEIRQEMIRKNKEVFDLEAKTGWRTFGDINPETYIPIQFDSKALKTLTIPERFQLITSMAKVRRASKLANKKLDRNTLITMGILDIRSDYTLFTKSRYFVDSGATTTLDATTLKRLLIKEHDLTTVTIENAALMLDNEHGKAGNTYFTITEGNIQRVYRNPRMLDDLSPADQAAYKAALAGDQTKITPRWQKVLLNKDLVDVEMNELLDYKMNQGRYRRDSGKLINGRPDIAPADDPAKSAAIQNFTPEEVFSSNEVLFVTRTNMRASYQKWLDSRLFDLKVQETIDGVVGHTGLRPETMLQGMERRILDGIEADPNLTTKQKSFAYTSAKQGMDRLHWSYSEMNGTIPNNVGSAGTFANNAARTARNLIALRGLAWGMSSSPESLLRILKSTRYAGLSIPVDVLRFTGALLKGWDRQNPSLRYAVDDLCTSLEDYSNSHATHMIDGMVDVDLELDGVSHTSIWSSENQHVGPLSGIANLTDKLSQSSLLLGGLQQGTQFTRGLAKTTHLGQLSVYILGKRSAAVREFLALRKDPSIAAEMDALLEASFTSATDERRLSKRFKELSRKSGLSYLEAQKVLMMGIDSTERLNAIQWGLNESGMTGNRVDFIDLNQLYYQLERNPNIGIDANLFKDTVSRYQYGLENLIRKRSVSHAYGLNKPMSAFHMSEMGKLVNSLTSWLRSWQDDVVMNASERGSAGLLLGGLFAAASIEVLVFTMREWISGRDMEDILLEIKERPVAYVTKVASRLPLFGSFTPITETAIKWGVAAQSGSQRSFNALMQSMDIGGIGASSLSGMGRNILSGLEDIGGSFMEKDPKKTQYGSGIAKVVQAFVPYNSSQFAIPARLLETTMDLDEQSALMQFQDMVQKEAKPYKKSGGTKSTSSSWTQPSYAPTQPPTSAPSKTVATTKPFTTGNNRGASPALSALLRRKQQ